METPATRSSVSEQIPPVKKQQFWKTGSSGAYLPEGAFPPAVQELVTFTVPPEPSPRESPAAPERALWRAVFEDAIRVFCDRIYLVNDQDRIDARAWILSHDIHMGSFDFICHILARDPEYVRTRLMDLERSVAAKSIVGEFASADPKPKHKGGAHYSNAKRQVSKRWSVERKKAAHKTARSRTPLNHESPEDVIRLGEQRPPGSLYPGHLKGV